MDLRTPLKKLIYKEKSSSVSYIRYLRKVGVKVGEHCSIYVASKTSIDTSTPWMLEIGDYVRITEGVTILTHDYSFSVLSAVEGNVIGGISKTKIGNNVFIGRYAIILRGVTIGNNVIIGAGAVVTKDCSSNSVYAGNPARRICSIEEMYERHKRKSADEAKTLALEYYKKTGKMPDEKILREYTMLFGRRDKPIDAGLRELMQGSSCYDICMEYFVHHKPEFDGLGAFLKWCGLLGMPHSPEMIE